MQNYCKHLIYYLFFDAYTVDSCLDVLLLSLNYFFGFFFLNHQNFSHNQQLLILITPLGNLDACCLFSSSLLKISLLILSCFVFEVNFTEIFLQSSLKLSQKKSFDLILEGVDRGSLSVYVQTCGKFVTKISYLASFGKKSVLQLRKMKKEKNSSGSSHKWK